MNTFTKTISSTIRISYIVLPPHLVDKFYSKMSFYACTVSNFEQYTLARFIQEGYFEKHINRMRRYYLGKKNAIIDMIKSGKLNKRCEILEEDAGLHFLLKIKTEKSAEDIKKAAHIGVLRVHFGDDIAPQLQDLQHIGLVHAGNALVTFV